MNPQIWVYVGGTVIAVTGIAFIIAAWKRQWTRGAMIVGLAHLGIVWLDSAAPFRGLLDPAYRGFTFGFFSAKPGLEVAFLAGSIVACALASALIAVRNQPGKRMLIVTGTSTVLAWNVFFPLLADLVRDPGFATIELGEFLTIPPLVTVPLLIGLFVLPFAWGARWSVRRAFDTAPTV